MTRRSKKNACSARKRITLRAGKGIESKIIFETVGATLKLSEFYDLVEFEEKV